MGREQVPGFPSYLRKLLEDVLSPNKDIKKKEVDMVSKKNKNPRHRGTVKSLENA